MSRKKPAPHPSDLVPDAPHPSDLVPEPSEPAVAAEVDPNDPAIAAQVAMYASAAAGDDDGFVAARDAL